MSKTVSVVASVMGMVCLCLAAAPAPVSKTAPGKTAQPAKSTLLHHALANPHLHNAQAAVAHAKASTHPHLARHWHRRWSFAEWAVVHRGTGTVIGDVHSKSGSPVAGAQVNLRKANGGTFRNVSMKHIVHTNSAGTFIMRHVRIGSYRVRAEKSKANGHVSIHLHGGTTAMANVRI